jgi:hypothetical protein
VGQLAAAAQAAEEQAVQLMQQVQAANAAEAGAARESSALAGQVCSRSIESMQLAEGVKGTGVRTGCVAAEVGGRTRLHMHVNSNRSCSCVQVQALEQQASELSTLLGRQSGDVALQPQQSARRALFARRSLGSLDGTSAGPTPGASVSGGSEFVPSDAGSEGGDDAEAAAAGDQDAAADVDAEAAAAGDQDAVADVDRAAEATPAPWPTADAVEAAAASDQNAGADVDRAVETTPAPAPTADDAAAWPKAELSHPLAQPEQAAPSQTAESSVPTDVPQMRATLRSDSQLQRAGSGGVDSPSRHQFDGASAAVRAWSFSAKLITAAK